MSVDSLLPQLNHLVLEAASWQEEFDTFDVNSSDPDSLAKFNEICRLWTEANVALVQFVSRNSGMLMMALEGG